MKLKLILSMILLAMATTSAFANAKLQAGDIEVGAKTPLRWGELVSYYSEGTTGSVTFTCDLDGDGSPSAYMGGGKNFKSAPGVKLLKGSNGPFTFTFKDAGFKVGNIRIRLDTGENVTVRCIGKKS